MNISLFDLALMSLMVILIPVIGLRIGQHIHKLFGSAQEVQDNRPPSWQEKELVRVPAYSSSCQAFRRRRPDIYN